MLQAIQNFDLDILDWIARTLHCAFLDFIMPIVTLLGESGIFWIAVALVLVIIPKTRKLGIMLGISFVLGLLIGNITLKPLIHRLRPYDYIADVLGNSAVRDSLLVKQMTDFSFPSGHSLVCFEAAGVLMLTHRKPWGWIVLVSAFLVAFSRLYLYVHYPSDVLTGALLGFLFGCIGVLCTNRIFRLIEAKKSAGKPQ